MVRAFCFLAQLLGDQIEVCCDHCLLAPESFAVCDCFKIGRFRQKGPEACWESVFPFNLSFWDRCMSIFILKSWMSCLLLSAGFWGSLNPAIVRSRICSSRLWLRHALPGLGRTVAVSCSIEPSIELIQTCHCWQMAPGFNVFDVYCLSIQNRFDQGWG